MMDRFIQCHPKNSDSSKTVAQVSGLIPILYLEFACNSMLCGTRSNPGRTFLGKRRYFSGIVSGVNAASAVNLQAKRR